MGHGGSGMSEKAWNLTYKFQDNQERNKKFIFRFKFWHIGFERSGHNKIIFWLASNLNISGPLVVTHSSKS